ncbi:hypothetical protein RhiTH_004829 [Rhizoctonia solani]
MFYGALLTFVTSILLPYFVKNPDLRARGMESLSLGAEEGSGAVRSAPPPRGFNFVTSVRAATAIFALQGLCSATTHWVPFAIIATAAHKDAFKTMGPNEEYLAGNLPREQEYLLDSSASERYPPEFAGDAPNRAGLFLGIHNVFVVLPQFLSISLSAIIFSLRDPGRSVLGGVPTEFTSAQKLSSLTVILSIGGLNSLVAAFLTRKLLN